MKSPKALHSRTSPAKKPKSHKPISDSAQKSTKNPRTQNKGLTEIYQNRKKPIPLGPQTHRNGRIHQIQSLPETAEKHAIARAESKKRREDRSREKPELQQSPNQHQIKPSRHKSANPQPLLLLSTSQNPSLSLCSITLTENKKPETKSKKSSCEILNISSNQNPKPQKRLRGLEMYGQDFPS